MQRQQINYEKLRQEKQELEKYKKTFNSSIYKAFEGKSSTAEDNERKSALQEIERLENSGELKKEFNNWYKSLHHLAEDLQPGKKHCQLAIEMLESGEDLHHRDNKGRTPLCVATFNGHSNLMLIFLSWGAKVNIEDVTHYSPKLFQTHYTCDHEFDPGACIPLKKIMDEPKRALLAKLEKLEKKYIHQEAPKPYFNFNEIKDKIFELLQQKDFKDRPEVRNALCGYVTNNLQENERKAAFTEFCHHYKTTYQHEITRDGVYRSLPEDFFADNRLEASISMKK